MRADEALRSHHLMRFRTTSAVPPDFPNKQALPALTLVQVPRLANPAFLLEIEAIAILPPKA